MDLKKLIVGLVLVVLGIVFLLLGTAFTDQMNTRNRSLQKVSHFNRRESLTNTWIARVVAVLMIVGGGAIAIIR